MVTALCGIICPARKKDGAYTKEENREKTGIKGFVAPQWILTDIRNIITVYITVLIC